MSENIGIIKATRIIKKLDAPVRYKVLNFSNPKLIELFFFKIIPCEDKNF